MKTFDLIVIGAGSGLDVAVETARRGWKTAIIEEGPLGGTCLNRGCIPSKMVIHSADVAEEIQKASLFGIHARLQGVDFRKVTGRASRTVDQDSQSIKRSLQKGKNPQLYQGKARFLSPREVQVNGEVLHGKRILIAAGARPSIPRLPGLDQVPYLTSTEALRLTVLPQSMVIIGGGYIGVEMGHFYAALGCKVTIIQRGPLLIPREDQEIAETFTRLWKQRYGIVCNCDVVRVERRKEGIAVHTQHQGKAKTFVGEKLLIATGLQPNSDVLDLPRAGVKTNERGFIRVNGFLQTSVPHIWALGDIAGVYLFKHSANKEAECLLQNWFGKKRPVDYVPMPHAIFTHPQIAGVGFTEQECLQLKKKYLRGKYEYQHTGMGAAIEEKEGFVKFLVDKTTREILGCHILGPQASTLIHEVVVALRADRKNALKILQEAIHVHPALSEVVQRAALQIP